MDKIVTLLEIQKLARDAQNEKSLGFVAVNKTSDIIPYTQAVFWTYHHKNLKLISVNGNAVLDNEGPYAIAVADKIQSYLKQNIRDIKDFSYDAHLKMGGPYNYIIPFYTQYDGIIGGLLIEGNTPINEDNKKLLSEISEHYAQSLALIFLRKNNKTFFKLSGFNTYKKYVFLILLFMMLFPVRLSITAPAEIVAKESIIITAPYDGIIDEVKITPGSEIKDNDVLAIMDKTQLQSKKDAAQQAMKTAEISLSRTGLESLRNDTKKIDLMRLQSEIKTKKN